MYLSKLVEILETILNRYDPMVKVNIDGGKITIEIEGF